MLLHHPNGTLAHLGGKRVCLVHGSILSRVGASSNPGAVQPGDRAALVEGLIGSLDQPDPAMDSLWLKEAEDRMAAYRSGELGTVDARSEEHTSELQSLMRISSAVFCLKKK